MQKDTARVGGGKSVWSDSKIIRNWSKAHKDASNWVMWVIWTEYFHSMQ